VEDLCGAHLLVLEKLNDSRELIYNLGNGRGYSVREVIETVKKVCGKDFEVVESGRRPGDAPVLTSDASKAIKELGWKTKFGDLKSIVKTAWQWHNEHPNGYED
jgi:UDP-glucose 4-epimerase